MNSIIFISAGGFLGAASRYLLGKYVNKLWKGSFPLGTFTVNVIGSFLLGLVILHPGVSSAIGSDMCLGIGVGFLGSFTTFSTFEYETMNLLEKGKIATAAIYVLLSFCSGFGAAGLASLL